MVIEDNNSLFVRLMHKDVEVAYMKVGGDKPKDISFYEDAADHIPLGAKMNLTRFHEWWEDRAVPRTRQGAKKALRRLGYANTGDMLIDNLALSLTDCYWIKPVGSDITWEDVNLYKNPFEDYFGAITIDQDADIGKRSRFSLATSQGEVRKKWVIRSDGTRAMVKGNWGESYQQSINEVFASKIHELQGVMPYTEYNLVPLEMKNHLPGLGCISDLFTSEQVEFVSAWEVMCSAKKKTDYSYFQHFKKQCMDHGMDEEYFDRFQSYEILTDFLMSNTDRHMNNIGIIRDPDTLSWIGFAPIYDTGNAMFFNDGDLNWISVNEIKVTSFLSTEDKMLRYATHPDIVDLSKLPSKDEFYALYEKEIPERHGRIDRLWELFMKKADMVAAMQ